MLHDTKFVNFSITLEYHKFNRLTQIFLALKYKRKSTALRKYLISTTGLQFVTDGKVEKISSHSFHSLLALYYNTKLDEEPDDIDIFYSHNCFFFPFLEVLKNHTEYLKKKKAIMISNQSNPLSFVRTR